LIGKRLGPYEITAKLGEGGMGVVYRAKDSQLGREVALKVLPEGLTDDPERLARFEREAKLLAQLNHPNIAQIHGLERSGETRALVMELVEGPTLAERLRSGSLSLTESLSIARQVAEALEEAHEKGIVHRDLKPQNIKAANDGKVKVLDFGLAKAVHPLSSAGVPVEDFSDSPTVTFGGTLEGVILGTAAFMAPEQARGAAVDKRADIWAFGVVLFEMLTGERLFAEDSVVDTLSAVMRKPIDLAPLPDSIPLRLRELVQRCLERDLKRRLHDIGDARIVIEDLLAGGLDEGIASTKAKSAWSGMLAASFLSIVAGFIAGSLWTRAPKPVPAAAIPRSFQQLTEIPELENEPSLSPDGRRVVYVAEVRGRRELFLLRVGGRNSVPLTPDSSDDDHQPAFSPDGEHIAFRSERAGGGIFVMGSTGESVRRLTDFGFDPSWSPDSREIVVSTISAIGPNEVTSTAGDLWAIEIDSGERRKISSETRALDPAWSPHGHRIAYWSLRSGSSGQRDIFTVAASGSSAENAAVAVTNDAALDWGATWSPDGRQLYFSSNRGGTMNLWRIAIDEASGRTFGEPQPITLPAAWSGPVSLARDGRRLAFAAVDRSSTLFRQALDPESRSLLGSPQVVIESGNGIRDHRVSPDGQWVVMSVEGAQEDLAVVRIDGSRYLRLTNDGFRDRYPIWSPDGGRILFASDRGGSYAQWTIHPDGSGLEPLNKEGEGALIGVWSPDGSRIAASVHGSGWELVDMTSASRPRPARKMPSQAGADGIFYPTDWSPDGSRLVGNVLRPDGSIHYGYVYSLTEGTLDHALGSDDAAGAGVGIWSLDSRHLLMRSRRGISLVDSLTHESRRLISVEGYFGFSGVGISRDNRWITWTRTAMESDIWLADLDEDVSTR